MKYKNSTSYAGRASSQDHTGQARFGTNAEIALGVAKDLAVSASTLASAVGDLVPSATTLIEGVVLLTDNSSPVATKLYADNLAIAGSPNWSETVSGIGQLSTNAEAVAVTNDTTAMTPLKVGAVFAAPPSLGSGTPAAGAFTTLAASGLSSLSASATILTAGAALNLGSDNDAGAVNLGVGTTARAINIGSSAAAHIVTIGSTTGIAAVDLLSGTGGISLASTGAGDITIDSDDTVLIDADGVIDINSSAGVISIGNDADSNNINVGTAGARVITVGNSTGATSVVLESGTGAIDIGVNAIAHSVSIGNKTGATALALDVGTGGFVLDGVTNSTYSVGASTTTGTISIGGTAGTGTMTLGDSSGTNIVQIGSGEGATTVNIAGGATNPKTVTIATGAVANLVTIGSASGAASLDLLCGTGDFTLEGDPASDYTIGLSATTGAILIGGSSQTGSCTFGDSDGTNTVNIGTGEGSTTISIGTGATAGKTVNIATGAIDNDVTIGSATGTSSLDLLCGTGDFTLNGSATSDYTIGAATTSGAISIGGSSQTGTMTLAGGNGAQAINIASSTGGKTVGIANGAGANAVTIGSTNTTSSLVLQAGSGKITMTGTVKQIDANFLFTGGTDLIVSQSPILQSALTTGAAPTGATGDTNLMYMQDGCLMEQFILGAGQTIIAPRMATDGLNIALDQTDNEGAIYNFGPRAASKHSYVIGTDAAFFMEARFTVADVTGCEPLYIGFRKVEANATDFNTYTDRAFIGLDNVVSAGNVVLNTEIGSAGSVTTNTTDAWADAASHVIKVLVSAAGVVTYEIDGVAPSATAAYTFTNALVVMPEIFFLNGADVAGNIELETLKIGFQA